MSKPHSHHNPHLAAHLRKTLLASNKESAGMKAILERLSDEELLKRFYEHSKYAKENKAMRHIGRAFVLIAFLLFGALSAFGQQFKFPNPISVTAPGVYPNVIQDATGVLSNGTYSLLGKISLTNTWASREAAADCQLFPMTSTGAAMPNSVVDDTTVSLDDPNGANTSTIVVAGVVVVGTGTPNNFGVHCFMSNASGSYSGVSLTATSLQGPVGLPGITPNVSVGKVTTLQPGAAVTITLDSASTLTNPIFDFGIPEGLPGVMGPQGAQGIQGEIGPQGPAGPQGIAGTNGINGTDGATGLQGPTGASGRSPFQGTWNASATYQVGDMVFRTPAASGEPVGPYFNLTGLNQGDPWADNLLNQPLLAQPADWAYASAAQPTPSTAAVASLSIDLTCYPPNTISSGACVAPPPPQGNGVAGGNYSVTIELFAGGLSGPETGATGTFTIDPATGNMTGTLNCGSANGTLLPGSNSDTFVIQGCTYGGSVFQGTATFTNADYNLTFNAGQVNCGGCGNVVEITGIQKQ